MGELDHEELKYGKGVLIEADGSLYEGYFKDDLKCGHGRQIYPNGKWYQGGWINGKYHGFGRETNPNSIYCEGIFEYGKLFDGAEFDKKGKVLKEKKNGAWLAFAKTR